MTNVEYDSVLKMYYYQVYRVCFKLIQNKEDAEDITMTSFEILWNKKDDVKAASAKAYVMITARNKCFDLLRERKTKFQFTPLEIDVIEQTSEIESFLFSEIYKSIEELPPHQKEVIKYRFIEGLKTGEIAKKLNKHPDSISRITSEAIQKLKWKLKWTINN